MQGDSTDGWLALEKKPPDPRRLDLTLLRSLVYSTAAFIVSFFYAIKVCLFAL